MNNRIPIEFLIGCASFPVAGYILFGRTGFDIGATAGIVLLFMGGLGVAADLVFDFDST